MSELPNGWEAVPLGEVITVRNGYAFKSADFTKEGVPVVKQSNLTGSTVDLTDCAYVSEAVAKQAAAFSVKQGDLILGMSGSIGEPSVYRYEFGAVQNQRTGLIKFGIVQEHHRAFIKLALVSYERDYASRGKGIGVQNVSARDIEQTVIPLPPLPEQKRIVAKIDSLSSKSKRAREHLEHLPRLVEKYKQAVLAAAFRGDLTKEWRATNSVPPETHVLSDLTSELSGLEFSTSWTSAAISELAENHDGKRRPIRAADRSLRHGQYRYYGASGVIDSIDDYLFDGDYLLIGEDGANLISRSTPIAFLASGQFWVNNHAHILKAKPFTSNAYLCWFINLIDLVPYVSGSAQPKLTQANLNKIRAPLPPSDEQLEIVRRIEHVFSWIDRLASEAGSARKLVDRLDQTVLEKAFRGELVPQNPADEPASVLLERIKAERSEAPKTRRSASRTIR